MGNEIDRAAAPSAPGTREKEADTAASSFSRRGLAPAAKRCCGPRRTMTAAMTIPDLRLHNGRSARGDREYNGGQHEAPNPAWI